MLKIRWQEREQGRWAGRLPQRAQGIDEGGLDRDGGSRRGKVHFGRGTGGLATRPEEREGCMATSRVFRLSSGVDGVLRLGRQKPEGGGKSSGKTKSSV